MRKRSNIIIILLIAACVAAFFGYRMLDDLRTDTQPPEIILGENVPEISVYDSKDVLLQGITARDKKDGDVTELLVVERVNLLDSDGRIMVSYAAFDRSGNVSKAQREARYTDYQPPKLTLSTPLIFPYSSSFDILSVVGAQDVVDGDIQHRVRATLLEEGSISERVVHNVRFQVTNSLGDMVSYVLPVEAYDPMQYVADLKLTQYLIYLTPGGSFAPQDYLDSFSLQGEIVNLRSGLPKGYKLETTGEVQTGVPVVYAVEYRVTYTIQNEKNRDLDQHFAAYSKLIVIVEG